MSKRYDNFDMLSAYADGELTEAQAQRISSSEEDSALLELYREISIATSELDEPVPDELRIGVMKAIAAEGAVNVPLKNRLNRRMLLTRAMPIAACLAVALLAWSIFGDYFFSQGDNAADSSGGMAPQAAQEAAMSGGFADESGSSDEDVARNAFEEEMLEAELNVAGDTDNSLADTVPNATPIPMPAGGGSADDSAPAPAPPIDAAEPQAEPTRGYMTITAEEAKKLMDEADEYILLDVRTEEEYLERRIDGAILIPHTGIADRAPTELTDKDALIFVYCRAGVRSAAAAQALADMGYTRVYDIGGILDWPYETVK